MDVVLRLTVCKCAPPTSARKSFYLFNDDSSQHSGKHYFETNVRAISNRENSYCLMHKLHIYTKTLPHILQQYKKKIVCWY
jgi:hypothetical protein